MVMTRGYKQSQDHIRKRIRSGDLHARWSGDGITVKGGRARALRMYPVLKPCESCGSKKSERHHIDNNTANNDRRNIRFLCRRCHMDEDGRLQILRIVAKDRIKEAIRIAAELKRNRTACKCGHSLIGDNLYRSPQGKRICKSCRRIHKLASIQRKKGDKDGR
jgi:hypothetical protein